MIVVFTDLDETLGAYSVEGMHLFARFFYNGKRPIRGSRQHTAAQT